MAVGDLSVTAPTSPGTVPVTIGDGELSAVPTARRTGRQRRPSGAPPPLPRQLGTTGRGWAALTVVLIAWLLVAMFSPSARRLTDQVDAAVLRVVAGLRTEWLTTIARGIDRMATGWTLSVVAMVLLVATIAFKRWRHLFTFLGSVILLQVVGVILIGAYRRPRPYDVTIIGRWDGFSLPSAAAAIVSITVIGVLYMLVVPGRPRRIGKAVGAVVVLAAVASRLYLGVDHPFDVLTGVTMGVAIPLVAFRFFTPNEVVPVAYHGGKTAHLDVGGRRGEAIRRAVEEQLGVTVLDVRPVGLGGSGGSTPLRLRLAGNPDTYVFGKLYAMNHVRSDRWYKIGRTILYGRLEDEHPFQTVRRLVEYEDYALRVMRDAGIPTAAPLGIVELTPEREYMLVTEFFDGAVEIGEADIDDDLIDQGLSMVRRMWQAGLAHRDIKPANLMVRDGRLLVIDVAFAQVRPSPWREAIDLANMMLVLAVRSDAERVYRRALDFFSPDEIAEAFAAARGIASPSQLRSMMKRDGRDLLGQFRALAPARRPISLQRWGPRRILLAAGVLAFGVVAVVFVYESFTPAELPIDRAPECGTDTVMVLMAQAVPSAAAVPCVSSLPTGWSVGGVRVRRGEAKFWLDSDQAGGHAVEVALRPPDACAVDGATEVPTDEPGLRRFERVGQLPPDLEAVRTYLAPGMCVRYRFDLDGDVDASATVALDAALAFQPREELVDAVDRRSGLVLCGAGAPECTGGAG
jgi:tRNA A-37 threonylcarbamoyl transferase component Bud32